MPLPPSPFVWRRLHSIAGLFLVIFLIFHLLTNSQAALWIGKDGLGFIHEVNLIQNLPYLFVIESVLLGIPFIIHGVLGVWYALSSSPNSWGTDGSTPHLNYERNHAYTWQRITSWVLLFAIAAHVIQMRFYNYPSSAQLGAERFYMQRIEDDAGLITLAARLDFDVYTQKQIEKVKAEGIKFPETTSSLLQKQQKEQQKEWLNAIESRPLKVNQVVAVTKDFGTATLLLVRDTFKSPIMVFLYSIFVIFTCFHAFNGVWTALIKWGITLNEPIRRIAWYVCFSLMILVSFLGLSAIWGTFWFNLKI